MFCLFLFLGTSISDPITNEDVMWCGRGFTAVVRCWLSLVDNRKASPPAASKSAHARVSCLCFVPLPTATVTHGLAATNVTAHFYVFFYVFRIGFLLLYSPQLGLWLLIHFGFSLGFPFFIISNPHPNELIQCIILSIYAYFCFCQFFFLLFFFILFWAFWLFLVCISDFGS